MPNHRWDSKRVGRVAASGHFVWRHRLYWRTGVTTDSEAHVGTVFTVQAGTKVEGGVLYASEEEAAARLAALAAAPPASNAAAQFLAKILTKSLAQSIAQSVKRRESLSQRLVSGSTVPRERRGVPARTTATGYKRVR